MAKQTKPPVVTILGHVDHGKTTLLDHIRQTNVQAGESGGITQHIGAYQIEHQGKKITFIDTPGHAAFNKMRQRGAEVTDIVILVVAANDGVKPQTIESIRHIKESNASYIVAINKIDLEAVQPDVIKGELAEHDVLVTDLGGEVEVVEISAKTGQGVDKLLETINVMAELMELKADPQAPLEAVVIESKIDKFQGPIASVIVQEGSLKTRQDLTTVAANPELEPVEGRVKALLDEQGQHLKVVEPGSPVEILGLNSVPEVGSIIHDQAVDYKPSAEEETEKEVEAGNQAEAAFADWDFEAALNSEEGPQKINLLVKADVKGTLEAIVQTLDEDQVELIEASVGLVSEGDVELAAATDSTIIAFRVPVAKRAQAFAEQEGVKIREYDVIYHLIEALQKQMLKLMEPRIDEVETGEAEILEIFEIDGRKVAGGRVITGEINQHDQLHLMRAEKIVADPEIARLQHNQEQVETVTAKSEFGISFKKKKLDLQVGDKLIAYHEED